MKLAFDMSSFIWTCLLVGKDPEALKVVHEDKAVTVNTAAWGYENAVNSMLSVMKRAGVQPIDCILVFEGTSSKARRLMIDKDYKSGRDSRPPEAYIEFQKTRDKLEAAWRSIGALAMRQDLAEGDDSLAWLAENTREDLIVASNDWDIAALHRDPGVLNEHGAQVTVWIGGTEAHNKYGGFDCRHISLYKALVGDSSDNIKGIKGFGDAAFKKLVGAYGLDTLDELQGYCEEGQFPAELHAMAAEETKGPRGGAAKPVHPLLRQLCEGEAALMKCWRLARMHPEWVNTMREPVQWAPGIVLPMPENGDERLAPYHQQKVLVTAENFTETLAYCKQLVASSPFIAFDIETSITDEGQEWLDRQGDPDGLDQRGSVLTGFSFTFGANTHRTVYVSVDHARTANVRMSQARAFIEAMTEADLPVHATINAKDVVIHNNHFELPVLYDAQDEDGTYWRDHWADNGFHGFIPRSMDTKLEASYQDENLSLGLKFRSKHHLGYLQTDYDEVTLLAGKVLAWDDDTIAASALPDGGRHRGTKNVTIKEAVTETRTAEETGQPEVVVIEPAVVEVHEIRRYRMNELPANHVFNYGCDDTICTAAQHIFYKWILQLENTWDVYRTVELPASYQHAKNFHDGLEFSAETNAELKEADDRVYAEAWEALKAYLIEKDWPGSRPPTFGPKITLPEIKEAFKIVHAGSELDTAVRTVSKLVKMLRDEGADEFAAQLEDCATGEEGAARFTAYVASHFEPSPVINFDSPKQLQRLMFDREFMNLPVQIRNKPTDLMKKKGEPGSPKTDELAMRYSMRVADEPTKVLLEYLWLMRMVMTRRELYYDAYPNFVHWKTGRIHPSHNQCAAATRRASESKPNKQQLAKHQKVELAVLTAEHLKASTAPRIRETILPHKPNAVVVSMDFNAQELRNIAEQSQDANLLACYVGEFLKDMHTITGHAILVALKPEYANMTYEEFAGYKDKCDLDKAFKKTPMGQLVTDFRARGKKVNFTTEYGAMAPKLAATMLVPEEDAQKFIDAREAVFPRVAEWKQEVIAEAHDKGYVLTMLGARRHLRDALLSENFSEASGAERQGVNAVVQGSCAEQTKLAEGRMWDASLFFRYDAVCYGPVHDELVASVAVDENFFSFLKEMHACMVADYAGMRVPIVSSISFGPNFGTQLELGDEPTAEAVSRALKALKETNCAIDIEPALRALEAS